MKLRGQLVTLGLLTLAFPLAGWFLFQAMHRDIQHSIGRSALLQAQTLAASLQKNLPRGQLPNGFPVAALGNDMQADGSDDDWAGVAAHEFGQLAVPGQQAQAINTTPDTAPDTTPLHSALRVGKDGYGHWWLWLRVFDTTRNLPSDHGPIAHPPFDEAGSPDSDAARLADRVVLGLVLNGRNQRLVFNRQPEGRLRAVAVSPAGFSQWQGVWHELADGYVLEMRLPASLSLQRLGFAARDGADSPETPAMTGTLSSDAPDTIALWPLIDEKHPLASELRSLLAESGENRAQALVLNRHGWILASTPVSQARPGKPWQWLQGLIYHWLFAPADSMPAAPWQNRWPQEALPEAGHSADEPGPGSHSGFGVRWHTEGADYSTTVLAQVPLADGWLILRQPLSDEQQSLMHTLLRGAVMALALIAVLLLVYLLYASVLAYRVRRLNRSLQHALDTRGRVQTDLPGQQSADEIGELARGLAALLHKVRDHTAYLKGFGSRLSHELKTPLAMVQGSLDNLQAISEQACDSSGENSPEHRAYVQRAQAGTARMRFILNQLSGLSRLHEALENTPLETVDLLPFLRQYVAARRVLMPDLRLTVADEPLQVQASLDLLAQGLDKLLDNAGDFTPVDGFIEVRAEKSQGPDGPEVVLVVFNSGSRLPDGLRPAQLFDSLISQRQQSTSGAEPASHHLGLGLYLLRLIAEHHGGRVQARNTATPAAGVVFELILPGLTGQPQA